MNASIANNATISTAGRAQAPAETQQGPTCPFDLRNKPLPAPPPRFEVGMVARLVEQWEREPLQLEMVRSPKPAFVPLASPHLVREACAMLAKRTQGCASAYGPDAITLRRRDNLQFITNTVGQQPPRRNELHPYKLIQALRHPLLEPGSAAERLSALYKAALRADVSTLTRMV